MSSLLAQLPPLSDRHPHSDVSILVGKYKTMDAYTSSYTDKQQVIGIPGEEEVTGGWEVFKRMCGKK